MVKHVLFLAILILVFISGCSTAEPQIGLQGVQGIQGEQGESGNITDTTTSNLTGILTADGSYVIAIPDVGGLAGLLADDQHVLDVEVVSAIEIASPLTLPEYTLGGSINLDGQVFDAGSDSARINTRGGNKGLSIYCTQDDTIGAYLALVTVSASPAVDDVVGKIDFYGNDSNLTLVPYGRYEVIVVSPTDGTESSKMLWWLQDWGGFNLAMTLSGDGVLAVDDSYDTFDDKDDAKLLKEGVKEGKKEVLEEIGVLKKKYKMDEDGVYILDEFGELIFDGYMINVQDFLKLLAGGVYQNRDKIDVLEARIETLEKLIAGK